MDTQALDEIEILRKRVAAKRGRQRELAQLCGMSQSWVSKFGCGKYKSQRFTTVQALRDALDRMEDAA
jgi:DNA-binding Xre family transcriptional regulator